MIVETAELLRLRTFVEARPDIDHDELVRNLIDWFRAERADAPPEQMALWIGELEYAAESPVIRIADALRAEVQRELALVIKTPFDN